MAMMVRLKVKAPMGESIPVIRDALFYPISNPGVVPPEFTKKVDPIFPEKAKEQGSKGRVVLEVVAGADGKMRDVAVIKVEGDRDVGFQDAATQAVMQWEFKPATLDGKPVDVLLNMHIDFRLN